MSLQACPFARVQGSDQLLCMLLPQYIVQASQHRPLCPHKHIQKGVIISQDVEMEDLPVHASLWVFWHDSLFRFTMLLFLLLEDMLNPTTLWAMCLCHLELQRWGWERQHCGFLCLCLPLMKCTVSSVPKLVTVLQVIKHGISCNPQWQGHAHILSCCGIRNAFSYNMALLSHVHAFLRRPICPQIVKFEDVINEDI